MRTPQENINSLRMIGFRPLTYPYVLPMEEEDFEACKAQLAKGFIPYAEVWYDDTEVEVWTIHDDPEAAQETECVET